jgi:hypothetical protein
VHFSRHKALRIFRREAVQGQDSWLQRSLCTFLGVKRGFVPGANLHGPGQLVSERRHTFEVAVEAAQGLPGPAELRSLGCAVPAARYLRYFFPGAERYFFGCFAPKNWALLLSGCKAMVISRCTALLLSRCDSVPRC